MITGDDKGPYNTGPTWLNHFMKYTKDLEAGTYTVQSPMMRTPDDYPVKSARGFHYCKILSPFRVMEWIYVDGLLDKDGIHNDYDLRHNIHRAVDDIYDRISEKRENFKEFANNQIDKAFERLDKGVDGLFSFMDDTTDKVFSFLN